MLNVRMAGDQEFITSLNDLPAAVRQAVIAKVTALTIKLHGTVAGEKLHGEVLNVKTGALSRSIQWLVDDSGSAVFGKVYSAGDVKYAAIHEFGGVIKHPGGTAYVIEDGKAAWISNAKAETMAAVKRTKPHDIHMPERSYMRSTLAEMKDEIESGLREAVADTVKVKFSSR